MRIFATQQDYRDFTGDPEATASTRLLRLASVMVSQATRLAVYETDDQHMPTDQRVRDAMRDAVCAQVEWWDEHDDETGSGAGGNVQSASIAGVSFTEAPGGATGTALCDMALVFLAEAGLRPVMRRA